MAKATTKSETKTTATKTNATKPAVAAATKAVTAKKEDVKPAAVTKAEPKKEEKAATSTVTKKETKTTAKKTTKTAAKKPGRKPAKKTVEKVQEVFIEYQGKDCQVEKIIEKIHEAYRAEGHRVGAIKSLRVYIQPETETAYYVINDKEEGKSVNF